jgi:glycosyltransferase involved in cell wall biosynthesis
VFHRGKPPLHTIIPHHNYASLPNDVSRPEARRTLGIAENASVVLVFGAIRNSDERSLILDMFGALEAPNKLLLVSRWRETLANVSWIRLKYWIRDLKRLYYRLHPRFNFNYGFVEESDTQIYLNAADVLFIPRLHVLNSGNVTLGMTFGRVVVGPDSWDVGALLRETGNPVFDPDAPDTSVAAVERGLALAKRGELGTANRRKALTEWTAQHCAAQYRQFYDQVTQSQG